jgi:predicted transcriptional regulator
LAPAYTKAILEGTKTVELRRRRVHAKVGTRIWLYSKVPTARIEGTARIERHQEGDLNRLWAEFSNEVGVSKTEFEAYFRGCNRGYAIVLTEACAVTPAPDLRAMRKKLAGFHPPQFFKRLEPEEVKVLLKGCKMQSVDWQPSVNRQEKLS